MVFFSNWSLCLIAVSAMLGMLVSLKHIAITYQEERMVIHGRPGEACCPAQLKTPVAALLEVALARLLLCLGPVRSVC